MRLLKFRQPVYSGGKFTGFHYWGFDVDGAGGFAHPYLLVPSEQFTGLKDKNGKEIWQGDILTNRAFDVPNYYIRWATSQEYCGWVTDVKDRGIGNPFLNVNFINSEVIGNIHENPELLKDEDNGQ